MRPSAKRFEITILSFAMPLPGQLSQGKYYEMLYDTQTRRDNLLFMSSIDLLFSFSRSMIGSRRIFFFISSQCCVFMAELVMCKQVAQMHAHVMTVKTKRKFLRGALSRFSLVLLTFIPQHITVNFYTFYSTTFQIDSWRFRS